MRTIKPFCTHRYEQEWTECLAGEREIVAKLKCITEQQSAREKESLKELKLRKKVGGFYSRMVFFVETNVTAKALHIRGCESDVVFLWTYDIVKCLFEEEKRVFSHL